MRSKLLKFSILAICIFSFLWAGQHQLPHSASIAEQERQSCKIIYVVDGDTIVVDVEGRKKHLRLIGIDAPESRVDEKAERIARSSGRQINDIIAEGKRASAHLMKVVRAHPRIFLEYDRERYDRYDRLLAYAFLANGDMLNEIMLKDGFAIPLSIRPNVKYAERLKEAYQHALRGHRGLWK